MKTKNMFLIGIILIIAFTIASCKKVQGTYTGTSPPCNWSIPYPIMTFYSDGTMTLGNPSGTHFPYVQEGDKITFNPSGTGTWTFTQVPNDCLVWESGPSGYDFSSCKCCK